jgi:hypothetical protein
MGNTFVPTYSIDPRLATPISYITNPMAVADTSGWNTYADAAGTTPVDGTGGVPNVTLIRTTTQVLRGGSSFLLTKDAANRQGQGVSTDFTIDQADKATVLQIAFDYNASSGMVVGSSSDISVWVYDVTNSVLIPVAPYQLQGNGSNNFNFKGILQTNPNSTSYRLIIHVATTNATTWTLLFDNVTCGPQTRLFGAPITDWQSYVPSILGSTSNPTKGTITNDIAYWRRVGDSVQVTYSFKQSSGGANGTGTYIITVPSGLSIDTNKVFPDNVGSSIAQGVVGSAYVVDSSANSYEGNCHVYDSRGVCLTVSNDLQGPATVRNVFVPLGGGAVTYSLEFTVPISGWSSTVLMSNDTDTRVVAAQYRVAGGITSDASNPINFATKVSDTHGAVTTGSSWKFTVPISGWYRVSVMVISDSATTVVDIYKNGSKVGRLTSVNGSNYLSGSANIQLVAGDYIDLRGGVLFNLSNTDQNISIERVSGPSAIAATETVAFRRRRTNGSNQTVPTATVVPYEYDSPDYDTHNAWRTGVTYTAGSGTWATDPAYIIPVSGKYHFDMRVQWGSVTYAANDSIQIFISKNGTTTTLDAIIFAITQTASQNFYNNGSISLNCLAGDVIRFMVRIDHSGGNALTGNILEAWVDGERVGN